VKKQGQKTGYSKGRTVEKVAPLPTEGEDVDRSLSAGPFREKKVEDF